MTDITDLADSIREGVRELAQENERLRGAVTLAVSYIEDTFCECYDEYNRKRPTQCDRCSVLAIIRADLRALEEGG